MNFTINLWRTTRLEDVRRRQISVTPLVIVNPVPRGVLLAAVDVRNVGQYPAKDISFQFSAPSLWPKNDIPAPLRNGIAYLGPGQHLRFRAESFAKLLSEQAVTSTFEVTIEYTHGQLDERMTHVWPLDFEAYRDSMSIISDEQEVRRDTKDELKKLRESVERIRSWFDDSMTRLVGANGLDLSIYTLRNMQKLAAGLDVEKLSPYWWSASDFRKALSIEFELAMALETLFQCNRQIAYEEVAAVAGMTPALLHRFSATFELSIMSIAAEGEETAPLA